MDLHVRFLRYILENNLCDPQRDRILLAVSGGRDSVLLTHLFVHAGFEVGIAHCNFALRGAESDADEALVREYAGELKVPFFSKRFETKQYASRQGVSIQMAARDLRYAWFESIRRQAGFDYIAVAHHASDNVETLLINLLRGTGLRGLRGMVPKRGRIIRPLLFLKYGEVNAAVERFALRYRDDASNFSTDYLRNKLRLEVIPLLNAINPELEETFTQNMDHIGDVATFVDREIAERRAALFRPLDLGTHTAAGPGDLHLPPDTAEAPGFLIDLSAVRKMQPLKFVLYELLQPFSFTPAVCADLAEVLGRDRPVSGRQFSSATHTLLVDREAGLIRPLSWQEPPEVTVGLSPENPGTTWKNQRLELGFHKAEDLQPAPVDPRRPIALFDADQIAFPLEVRAWKAGDAFRPSGMEGKTRKLSDFFVSKKIPLWEKARVPIVVDANGVIIWVAPLRTSMDFNISPETRNVMIIYYFCENGSR